VSIKVDLKHATREELVDELLRQAEMVDTWSSSWQKMIAANAAGWEQMVHEARHERDLLREIVGIAELELMGAAEVGDLLGLKRQRVNQIHRTASFPKPVARLHCGPVWRADDIRAFAAKWQRTPGRPRKVPVGSPERTSTL
jgi:hypothetical protein